MGDRMSEIKAESTAPDSGALAGLTAGIVTAYVTGNALRASDMPHLVRSVYSTLATLGGPAKPAVAEAPVPPIPIKKTVTRDAIISLEDGKPYKSLKRHLTARGLSPEEYRRKWNLPPDYPMVAEVYAQRRSDLARVLGLGQIRSRKAAERRAAAAAE
ncbi:transcriptional regulator, MucR family [Methylobacterium sp. 4-46]|nr:transcriptional regulator, MucR family [Methylobacterium sp. 4-46]